MPLASRLGLEAERAQPKIANKAILMFYKLKCGKSFLLQLSPYLLKIREILGENE